MRRVNAFQLATGLIHVVAAGTHRHVIILVFHIRHGRVVVLSGTFLVPRSFPLPDVNALAVTTHGERRLVATRLDREHDRGLVLVLLGLNHDIVPGRVVPFQVNGDFLAVRCGFSEHILRGRVRPHGIRNHLRIHIDDHVFQRCWSIPLGPEGVIRISRDSPFNFYRVDISRASRRDHTERKSQDH